MQPKISVIVPVYKAEKYLRRCIDSILAQTFTDFELILVNDGSPDNCGAICDEYAAKDSRIRVFHKENGGVNAARRDGVENSNGEWITFVDADDSLPNDALETLYTNTSDEYDIIKGCYKIIGKQESPTHKPMILGCKEYRSETITNSFLHCSPWASLIYKRLFNDKTFNMPKELAYGEDMIMNIRLAFATNKDIKIIPDIVYNYTYNPTGCINTFKMTYDYKVLWYEAIYNSIPKEQISDYMNECIPFRLGFIVELCREYIRKNRWTTFDFHKTLRQDIKNYNYKPRTIDRIILSCNNPISSGIILFIRNIYLKLRET